MWRAVVVVLHDGGEGGLARLSGIKKRRSEKKLLEMLKTTVLGTILRKKIMAMLGTMKSGEGESGDDSDEEMVDVSDRDDEF